MVRIACAKELLDRAYGKPPQQIVGDADTPSVNCIKIAFVSPDGRESDLPPAAAPAPPLRLVRPG